MVELLEDRSERLLDVGKVHDPTQVRVGLTAHVNFDPERVAVQTRALVRRRDMRKPVRRFDLKNLEDVHGSTLAARLEAGAIACQEWWYGCSRIGTTTSRIVRLFLAEPGNMPPNMPPDGSGAYGNTAPILARFRCPHDQAAVEAERGHLACCRSPDRRQRVFRRRRACRSMCGHQVRARWPSLIGAFHLRRARPTA